MRAVEVADHAVRHQDRVRRRVEHGDRYVVRRFDVEELVRIAGDEECGRGGSGHADIDAVHESSQYARRTVKISAASCGYSA